MQDGAKIRWAPKVRQDKIWRLYQNDARGILDEALIDDVGLALLDRCRSVLMVNNGQVECPRCGHIFVCVGRDAPSEHDVIRCPTPGCTWETMPLQYHNSWRHRDLHGYNASPAFQTFVEQYQRASSPRQRMLLIDQLIHAFHQDLRRDVPHRSAANNLIEGNHNEVVAFLDRLAYGDESTPGTHETKEQWRNKLEAMQRLRQGGS